MSFPRNATCRLSIAAACRAAPAFAPGSIKGFVMGAVTGVFFNHGPDDH